MESNLEDAARSLGKFPWDSDAGLVVLKREHVCRALSRYLQHQISVVDVEAWANVLESREDVDFEIGHEDLISNVVYELANPILTEILTEERARELLAKLTSS